MPDRKQKSAAPLLRAIRKQCIDCMGTKKNPGYMALIRDCTTRNCPLWPYRFGMHPDQAAEQGRDVKP